jgi:hypothetical protein
LSSKDGDGGADVGGGGVVGVEGAEGTVRPEEVIEKNKLDTRKD